MSLAFCGMVGSPLKNFRVLSRNIPLCYVAVRNAGHWNKDWKPGPYPKSEEERRAAAKKYNLIPDDYEPYEDKDGMGYGDYPKLPLKSAEGKDPYHNWDIPHLKKNYGEPMHIDGDVLTEDKWSPDTKRYYSDWVMLRKFLMTCGGLALFMYLGPEDGYIRDLKPKQVWSPGVIHYSFDLEGSDGDHH